MHPTDSEIIDRLGGPSEAAALCEITPSAVTQWKTGGIPKPWRKYLELARPDAFAPVSEQKAAA